MTLEQRYTRKFVYLVIAGQPTEAFIVYKFILLPRGILGLTPSLFTVGCSCMGVIDSQAKKHLVVPIPSSGCCMFGWNRAVIAVRRAKQAADTNQTHQDRFLSGMKSLRTFRNRMARLWYIGTQEPALDWLDGYSSMFYLCFRIKGCIINPNPDEENH